jgi:hypothetical protein
MLQMRQKVLAKAVPSTHDPKWASKFGLILLDAGELDHLGPLLSFRSD